jgi:phage portal protein BeeE
MTLTSDRDALQAKARRQLQTAQETHDRVAAAARSARDAVVTEVAAAGVLTVQQVADAVGLSRATVFRILATAKDAQTG